MESQVPLRRLLLVVLAVIVAAVLYRVGGDALGWRSGYAPAPRTAALEASEAEGSADAAAEAASAATGATRDEVARERAALSDRVGEYLALRRADAWPELYELVDPSQRERVGLASFLETYGHGVLDVRRIEARALRLDPARGLASVDVHTEATLRPERLPPAFRGSLRIGSEADLQRSTDHSMVWVLHDGAWYYRLEQEILSGVDAEGRQVTGLGLPGG
ncbi:MAG: hypothetical protein H6825_10975 [Planctomycetes bacterium]|nr:hypothetical protein [Planctomycetota bacterium]